MIKKDIKGFKDYIQDAEKPKYAFNAHGSHAKERDEDAEKPKYAFNAHGSHAKENIVESVEHAPISEFLSNDLNKEHLEGRTPDIQMDKLHELHPFKSDDAKAHLKEYTNYSGDINKELLKAKENGTHVPAIVGNHVVQGLDASFTPSKIPLHTYSGLGFDPRLVHHEGKSKSGNPVFMSPTFLSSTHSKRIALSFARDNRQGSFKHNQVLHIETHPGQHIGVVGVHSHYPIENETIIPRNEYYEHVGTKTYSVPNTNATYEVHHVRRIPESEIIRN
jgi:hypothetical protein